MLFQFHQFRVAKILLYFNYACKVIRPIISVHLRIKNKLFLVLALIFPTNFHLREVNHRILSPYNVIKAHLRQWS